MRIISVDFPVSLINSLRDGTLVVFAGAGVSMGEPSNLPDFKRLAVEIACGTGDSQLPGELEDRFLGRLLDAGVRVHDLAVRQLSKEELRPTDLHKDLLRLFPEGAPLHHEF